MLNELLNARRESIKSRIEIGVMTAQQSMAVETLLSKTKIIILVTTDDDKISILQNLTESNLSYTLEAYSLSDMNNELFSLSKGLSFPTNT